MAALPAAAPLVARTVRLPDPGPLLALLPAGRPLAWLRRGEGLVGWGTVARIEHGPAAHGRGEHGPGNCHFRDAEQAWHELLRPAMIHDEVGVPGTGPVAFGSFAFSPASPAGGVLVVPEVVVGHRDGRWWLTTIGTGTRLPTAEPTTPEPTIAAPTTPEPTIAEPTAPELTTPERITSPGETAYADGAVSACTWQALVAEAIRRIGAGEVDKVVLARDLEARTTQPIDARWLLQRLAERYPGCWTFGVEGLIGATPEMLIRRDKGLVTSRVLAGTIQRTGDDGHDLALAASLARSSKDLEEHEYAVRSVADALAPYCTSMNLPESPFVLHLANVMHLATDVTGVLTDATNSLSLAAALHPSAAVCGTPTERATALIAQIEGMDRDRYAGPVGWMDANGDGEWGIALRCGRLDDTDPHRLRLFAGCGIVAGSDPETELAESDAKFIPMRDALATDD